MSEINWDADDVDFSMDLGVSGGEGPDLTGYPLLVYAPNYHGPGVRLEDNGTPVSAIAVAYSAITDIGVLARQFETDEQHIRQALAYAVANPQD